MSNGTDMLLGSMLRLAGVDPDMIKGFAQDMIEKGTLQKIIAFGEGIDETNALLRKIQKDYDNVCASCGGSVAPGPGSEPIEDTGNAQFHGGRVSTEHGSDRQSGNAGAACATDDVACSDNARADIGA